MRDGDFASLQVITVGERGSALYNVRVRLSLLVIAFELGGIRLMIICE